MLVTLRGERFNNQGFNFNFNETIYANSVNFFFLHRENKLEPDINSYTALLVVHAEAGNVEGIMEVRDHV